MVSKTVYFCVFAVLVQQSLAGPYCLPKPPCGCSSGKVVTKIEEIEEHSYKPIISSKQISSYKPSYSGSCVSIEIPSSGGSLAISSIGPIAPSGIAVATDLALGGDLELSGVLPYLSAVAFEGQFAASGAAPVAYGCGDCVAITEQIGGAIGGAAIGGSYGGSIGGSYGCGCKY